MKIEIENYVITADQHQFILSEKKVAQKGKNEGQEILTTVGYFQKLSWLIQALIVKEVRQSNVESLQALEVLIKSIGEKCESLLAQEAA
ncbi:DUF5405 family protein [Rosenbergiella nectarea]|uniref:DUF5405 family protein n=1 Tax=Rosenbergiella nectarea TaxID=988801 RepID=UPI001BDA7DD3|nr:DUF5405 family protein [Rosenbergiella nectarea]MBT0729560.1 DUF5405 family protein [Rosenbergiella nectarea subsp. apis]